jgi:hypothetical protein
MQMPQMPQVVLMGGFIALPCRVVKVALANCDRLSDKVTTVVEHRHHSVAIGA